MSFNDDLMRAEAIREVRASGCTTEGIAELIVDFHGAVHILANTSKIQQLGEEVAASDTEQGAKMRELLQAVAKKVEAETTKPVEKVSEITDSKPVATDQPATIPGTPAAPGAQLGADTATNAGNSAAPSESTAPAETTAQG